MLSPIPILFRRNLARGEKGGRQPSGGNSAQWLEPIDGVGMSVIVFEAKEQARQALARPPPPLPGVRPMTVQIREVYASA